MTDRTIKGMTLFGDINRSSVNSISTSSSSIWAVKLNRLHKLLTCQKTDLLTDLSMEELHLGWLEKVSVKLSHHCSNQLHRKGRGASPEANKEDARRRKYSPPASPTSQTSHHDRGSVKALRQRVDEFRRVITGAISHQDAVDARGLDISGTASGGGIGDISWLGTSGVDGRLRQFEQQVFDLSPTGRFDTSRRMDSIGQIPNNKRRATTEYLHAVHGKNGSPIPKKVESGPGKQITKSVKFKQSIADRLMNSAEDDAVQDGPVTCRSGSSAVLREPPLTDRLQPKALAKTSRIAQSHMLISTFDGAISAPRPPAGCKDKPTFRNIRTGHDINHMSKETLSSGTSAKLTPRGGLIDINIQSKLNASHDMGLHYDPRLLGLNSLAKRTFGPKVNHQQMLTGVGIQTVSGRQKASALSLIPNIQEDISARIRIQKQAIDVPGKITESLRQLIGHAHTPIRSAPSVSDASLPNIATTGDIPKSQKLVSFTTKTFAKHLGTEPKSAQLAYNRAGPTETSAKTAGYGQTDGKPKPSNTSRPSAGGLQSAQTDIDRMFRLYLK